jgi:hypothetical protein
MKIIFESILQETANVFLQLRGAKYCHCERSEAISSLGDCFPAELHSLLLYDHSRSEKVGIMSVSDIHISCG